MHKPFFSIILPTKDRPELVGKVLYSLSLQEYKDFEVIVSDNYLEKSCFHICKKYENILNIVYLKSDKFLSMHENYEYCLEKVTGKYLIALEDKSTLFPFALKYLNQIVLKEDMEMYSFCFDTFVNDNIENNHGIYFPYYHQYFGKKYSPIKSLKEKIKNRVDYWHQRPPLSKRNKILVGCWKMDLVNRILSKHKILFQPFSPDYTSMVFGALYCKGKAYDLGLSIGLAIKNDKYSNGHQCMTDSEKGYEFVMAIDPELNVLNELPFPEINHSHTNFIMRDVQTCLNQAEKLNSDFRINKTNIIFRAKSEYAISKNIPTSQINYLNSLIKSKILHSAIDKIYSIYYRKFHRDLLKDYLLLNFFSFLSIFFNFTKKNKYLNMKNHRIFCHKISGAEMEFEEAILKANTHYNELIK